MLVVELQGLSRIYIRCNRGLDEFTRGNTLFICLYYTWVPSAESLSTNKFAYYVPTT